jgi:hypothetical protein
MSAIVTAAGMAGLNTRKCSFCAEEILADAKKCRHCGEFVSPVVSKPTGAIFAAGLVLACVLAGTRPDASAGVLAVGVWAIFALLFARMMARS